jgi:hypothetical protein
LLYRWVVNVGFLHFGRLQHGYLECGSIENFDAE